MHILTFSRSIYLSGGVTLLPGFAERLQSELQAVVPPTIKVQVQNLWNKPTRRLLPGKAAQQFWILVSSILHSWKRGGLCESHHIIVSRAAMIVESANFRLSLRPFSELVDLCLQVHASPQRYHSAYIGACTLANLSVFEQSCITGEEWRQQGPSCLRKWHMYWLEQCAGLSVCFHQFLTVSQYFNVSPAWEVFVHVWETILMHKKMRVKHEEEKRNES